MQEPAWLTLDVILDMHDEQLAVHGGLSGVRDAGALESALSRAQNLFYYSPEPVDLADMAAALAFGLARNHPFTDGNKRTAFVGCRAFLILNGKDITASSEEKYETFLALGAGEITETDLAAWLRERLINA